MSIYLDTKYISLMGSRLDQFQKTSKDVWNFRCPQCLDSKKNKYKKRGYIYRSDKGYKAHCHNCGYHDSFAWFMKAFAKDLYNEYMLEEYRDGIKVEPETGQPEPKRKEVNSEVFNRLIQNVVALPREHDAIKFLQARKIPFPTWDKFYYIDDISKIVELAPQYEGRIKSTEQRIVIPYFTLQNKLVGVSCRSMNPANTMRYLNIRFNEIDPMVFNLPNVDLKKEVYVLEGAFDSTFIPNSVAVGSADLQKMAKFLDKENMILVFDNQPRNPQLISIMERMADEGYWIVIWPAPPEVKDVNEMILAGIEKKDILDMINRNIYNGLNLKLMLGKWKKIG